MSGRGRAGPYARAMEPAVPPTAAPATTIDDVIVRMKAIEAALPANDGVACFNQMYLEVTLGVGAQVEQGTFGDPGWVSKLDVVFANHYFAAIDSLSGPPSAQPIAWRPLLAARSNRGIEPIQFALAGMNIHINHDLPLAVVETCSALSTTPTVSPHPDDYQKIDKLLDAAEQSIRESFEPPDIRGADRHVAAVTNLVCNWSMNEARDGAWDTALAIWTVREHLLTTRLLTDALARIVAMGTRTLLVAV
jgi:Family of unknown function (DUF5995)